MKGRYKARLHLLSPLYLLGVCSVLPSIVYADWIVGPGVSSTITDSYNNYIKKVILDLEAKMPDAHVTFNEGYAIISADANYHVKIGPLDALLITFAENRLKLKAKGYNVQDYTPADFLKGGQKALSDSDLRAFVAAKGLRPIVPAPVAPPQPVPAPAVPPVAAPPQPVPAPAVVPQPVPGPAAPPQGAPGAITPPPVVAPNPIVPVPAPAPVAPKAQSIARAVLQKNFDAYIQHLNDQPVSKDLGAIKPPKITKALAKKIFDGIMAQSQPTTLNEADRLFVEAVEKAQAEIIQAPAKPYYFINNYSESLKPGIAHILQTQKGVMEHQYLADEAMKIMDEKVRVVRVSELTQRFINKALSDLVARIDVHASLPKPIEAEMLALIKRRIETSGGKSPSDQIAQFLLWDALALMMLRGNDLRDAQLVEKTIDELFLHQRAALLIYKNRPSLMNPDSLIRVVILDLMRQVNEEHSDREPLTEQEVMQIWNVDILKNRPLVIEKTADITQKKQEILDAMQGRIKTHKSLRKQPPVAPAPVVGVPPVVPQRQPQPQPQPQVPPQPVPMPAPNTSGGGSWFSKFYPFGQSTTAPAPAPVPVVIPTPPAPPPPPPAAPPAPPPPPPPSGGGKAAPVADTTTDGQISQAVQELQKEFPSADIKLKTFTDAFKELRKEVPNYQKLEQNDRIQLAKEKIRVEQSWAVATKALYDNLPPNQKIPLTPEQLREAREKYIDPKLLQKAYTPASENVLSQALATFMAETAARAEAAKVHPSWDKAIEEIYKEWGTKHPDDQKRFPLNQRLKNEVYFAKSLLGMRTFSEDELKAALNQREILERTFTQIIERKLKALLPEPKQSQQEQQTPKQEQKVQPRVPNPQEQAVARRKWVEKAREELIKKGVPDETVDKLPENKIMTHLEKEMGKDALLVPPPAALDQIKIEKALENLLKEEKIVIIHKSWINEARERLKKARPDAAFGDKEITAYLLSKPALKDKLAKPVALDEAAWVTIVQELSDSKPQLRERDRNPPPLTPPSPVSEGKKEEVPAAEAVPAVPVVPEEVKPAPAASANAAKIPDQPEAPANAVEKKAPESLETKLNEALAKVNQAAPDKKPLSLADARNVLQKKGLPLEGALTAEQLTQLEAGLAERAKRQPAVIPPAKAEQKNLTLDEKIAATAEKVQRDNPTRGPLSEEFVKDTWQRIITDPKYQNKEEQTQLKRLGVLLRAELMKMRKRSSPSENQNAAPTEPEPEKPEQPTANEAEPAVTPPPPPPPPTGKKPPVKSVTQSAPTEPEPEKPEQPTANAAEPAAPPPPSGNRGNPPVKSVTQPGPVQPEQGEAPQEKKSSQGEAPKPSFLEELRQKFAGPKAPVVPRSTDQTPPPPPPPPPGSPQQKEGDNPLSNIGNLPAFKKAEKSDQGSKEEDNKQREEAAESKKEEAAPVEKKEERVAPEPEKPEQPTANEAEPAVTPPPPPGSPQQKKGDNPLSNIGNLPAFKKAEKSDQGSKEEDNKQWEEAAEPKKEEAAPVEKKEEPVAPAEVSQKKAEQPSLPPKVPPPSRPEGGAVLPKKSIQDPAFLERMKKIREATGNALDRDKNDPNESLKKTLQDIKQGKSIGLKPEEVRGQPDKKTRGIIDDAERNKEAAEESLQETPLD